MRDVYAVISLGSRMVMPTPGVPGITTPSPAMVDMPVGKTCTNATFRGLALPAVNAARHSSLEDEAKPRGNYQHATDLQAIIHCHFLLNARTLSTSLAPRTYTRVGSKWHTGLIEAYLRSSSIEKA